MQEDYPYLCARSALLVVVVVVAFAYSVTFADVGGDIVFNVRKFGAVGDGRSDDTNVSAGSSISLMKFELLWY